MASDLVTKTEVVPRDEAFVARQEAYKAKQEAARRGEAGPKEQEVQATPRAKQILDVIDPKEAKKVVVVKEKPKEVVQSDVKPPAKVYATPRAARALVEDKHPDVDKVKVPTGRTLPGGGRLHTKLTPESKQQFRTEQYSIWAAKKALDPEYATEQYNQQIRNAYESWSKDVGVDHHKIEGMGYSVSPKNKSNIYVWEGAKDDIKLIAHEKAHRLLSNITIDKSKKLTYEDIKYQLERDIWGMDRSDKYGLDEKGHWKREKYIYSPQSKFVSPEERDYYYRDEKFMDKLSDTTAMYTEEGRDKLTSYPTPSHGTEIIAMNFGDYISDPKKYKDKYPGIAKKFEESLGYEGRKEMLMREITSKEQSLVRKELRMEKPKEVVQSDVKPPAKVYATPRAARALVEDKHPDVDKLTVTYGKFDVRQTLSREEYAKYKSFERRDDVSGYYKTHRKVEPMYQTYTTKEVSRLTPESEQQFRTEQYQIWAAKKVVETDDREISSYESAVMGQQYREEKSLERLGRMQLIMRKITLGGDKEFEERGYIGQRVELVATGASYAFNPMVWGELGAAAAEKTYLAVRGLKEDPGKVKEEVIRPFKSEELVEVYDPRTPTGFTTYVFAGFGAAVYAVGRRGVYEPGEKAPKGQETLPKYIDVEGKPTKRAIAAEVETRLPEFQRSWEIDIAREKAGLKQTESGKLIEVGRTPPEYVYKEPIKGRTPPKGTYEWESVKQQKAARAFEDMFGDRVAKQAEAAKFLERMGTKGKRFFVEEGGRLKVEEIFEKPREVETITKPRTKARTKARIKPEVGLLAGLGGASAVAIQKKLESEPSITKNLEKGPKVKDITRTELQPVRSTKDILASKYRVAQDVVVGVASIYAMKQIIGEQQPRPRPPKPKPKPPFGGIGSPEASLGGGIRNIFKRSAKVKGKKGKYAPSVSAVEFGIVGPEPKGTLTGLEERPLKRKKEKGKNLFDIQFSKL